MAQLTPEHKSSPTSALGLTPARRDVEGATIPFTTADALFKQIDSTWERGDDFLVVTDVSPGDFCLMEREREARRRRIRFRRYCPASKTVNIAIPSGIHEKLHGDLYRILEHKLVRVGLEDYWTTFHATTYHSKRGGSGGGPGGGSGEGDAAGGPYPQRSGGWPTLMILAGYSEPMRELETDMRWWFAASDHDVKIVIVAKFDRDPPQPRIILQRWEEETTAARPGTPMLQQTIIITRNGATDSPTYDVATDSTALVLSFRLLFLRDPGLGEGDFIFDVADLQRFATRIWPSTI